MSNWPEIPIRDIATIKGGKRLPKGAELSERPTPFPYVRVTDVRDGRISVQKVLFVPSEVQPKIAKYTISKDDVFISIVGTVGSVAKIPDELSGANLTENAAKISCDPDKVDHRYLRYFLQSQPGQDAIRAQTVGSTQPKLALFRIGDIKFPCPDKAIQSKIADMLSVLDDKIELNRNMNETLEAMAQAIFRDWFVDFGPTRRKIEGASDPVEIMGGLVTDAERAQSLADLFPAQFGDSGLPEGWGTTTIGSVFDVKIGRTPPRKEAQHFAGPGDGVPWMSIRDLGDCGAFISETSESLANDAVSKFRVPTIKRDTVVVSFKLTVGRVSIADCDMLSNEAIAQLAEGRQSQSRWITYLWMKNFDYSRLGSTSSIATAVNSNSIKSMEFPIVNDGLKVSFDQLVEPLFELIRNRSAESRTLAATRDLLLPKLMSGEISLGEASEQLEAAQ